MKKLPRDKENDCTRDMAKARRDVASAETGADLTHTGGYSFDPAVLPGNIENFIGVAQVPVGLAGPVLIDGEHAQGEFYVPMATTEGTLVASYSRGMRLCREAGGIKTTVIDDAMQRAPLFVFVDARAARNFGDWVTANFDAIKTKAEETTSSGKLRNIYYFSVTIPSLIIATYGGGTALPTQKECLDVLGCAGKGKAKKLAEIIAATVLCGELSLTAAMVSDEWVSSHDQYGRNRKKGVGVI